MFYLFAITVVIMALVAALTTTQNVIDAIAANGMANGVPYSNTAMPSTSHIRAHLKWPINADGTSRSLEDHICRYTRVDADAATRGGLADKADVETGVIVAVARLAAQRYYGWTQPSFNAAEVDVIPDGTANTAVHADHQAAVADALVRWSAVAARYMGLFYYNAISYETASHHHLPAVTKKLASTTVVLTGLKDWMAGDAEREGSVFHDMFHPLSDTEKSAAARRTAAKEHLSALKFDNLRKRIPVKAPDSGVAINYPVLFTKAKAYRHFAEHLPDELAPPPNLADAITAYQRAADAAALTPAITRLRVLSDALAEPSAYLAGFILGREAAAVGDVDLDLRTAARTTTILGSPAYKRAAGEYSGTFTAGRENGFRAVPASMPDNVLPRCAAALVSAAAL